MTETKSFSPVRYGIALAIAPLSLVLTQVLPQRLGIPIMTEEGFSTWQNAAIGIVVALGLLFTCLWLAKDKLKEDWPIWRAHWVRNALIAAGCAVFMFIALSPIAKFVTGLMGNAASMLLSVPLGLMNIGMGLASLTAPFSEEIIFRHCLTAPFSRRKWAYAVAILFSSAAFALMHLYNVSGNFRALVMYFLLGLFLSMVHWIARKNIWQNIMTHLFYNGYIVLMSIVGLVAAMFIEV
jgi:membrane protease YdiL (CAAX protease family)